MFLTEVKILKNEYRLKNGINNSGSLIYSDYWFSYF
jgi:hypothetical protein